ncbi:MAG TPA: VOC family protein [Ktedonobacterales bacterium]|jgi:catechol 2,3-dioxygenase-like lactoylglutathione lyase family enzyme
MRNQIAEVACFTADVALLAEFYEQVLGVEPSVCSDGMALFELSGLSLLIHQGMPQTTGQPPNEDHLAVAVADVDRACAALRDQGFALVLEPHNYEWGRSAYLRDPDGRLIELQDIGQASGL